MSSRAGSCAEMGDIEKEFDINLTSSRELTASLMEQLKKAFVELEASKVASTDHIGWNNIEEHFRLLESRLKKKLEDLEAKEKTFAEKEASNQMLLADREVEVTTKERDMLDKVQELKDVAVASIREAWAIHRPESPPPPNNGGNKVSRPSDYENQTRDASVGKSSPEIEEDVEDSPVEVQIDPTAMLTQFCEQMDSKGLREFVAKNLKNLSDVCKELLSVILAISSNPCGLVLQALQGFLPSNETAKEGGNADAERKSCLIILEALSAFLSKAGLAANYYLNPETKQHAVAVANQWKPKLPEDSYYAADINSLEAEVFLRLLVTFKIASEFNRKEFCEFILAVGHYWPAIEFCRSLELKHKTPAMVKTMVKSKRNIDAVRFMHAFRIDTRPNSTLHLLKSHLKELRRRSQGGSHEQRKAQNARELAAVKAVIQCIKDYKLEHLYPLEPLHRRVAQLDKSSKGDRKKTTSETSTVKPPEQESQPRSEEPQDGGKRGPSSPSKENVPYSVYADWYSSAVPSASSHPVTTQTPSYTPAPTITGSVEPYNSYYGQQDGSQPRNLYTPAGAAAPPPPLPPPSYGAYTQLPHYPYM